MELGSFGATYEFHLFLSKIGGKQPLSHTKYPWMPDFQHCLGHENRSGVLKGRRMECIEQDTVTEIVWGGPFPGTTCIGGPAKQIWAPFAPGF